MQSAGRRRSAPEHGCELPRSVRSESGSLKFNVGVQPVPGDWDVLKVSQPPELGCNALFCCVAWNSVDNKLINA